MKPDELMRLVLAHAAELRAAGVRRLRLGTCEVELAPPEGSEAIGPATVGTGLVETVSPLDDPVTFGVDPRRQDGRPPEYPARRRAREEGV